MSTKHKKLSANQFKIIKSFISKKKNHHLFEIEN